MKISTFGFLTRRGVRNLGKHWAMTIACIASLSVCMPCVEMPVSTVNSLSVSHCAGTDGPPRTDCRQCPPRRQPRPRRRWGCLWFT